MAGSRYLAGAAAMVLFAAMGIFPLAGPSPDVASITPQTVLIPAGGFDYRPAGVYRRDGAEVDAPIERRTASEPLEIMKYHVTRAEYARCVADGACQAVEGAGLQEDGDKPQVDVSFRDARAYAAWLSDRTGEIWRLPTDAEWARAAAERMVDDGLDAAAERLNGGPAARWLASYDRATRLRPAPDLDLRASGAWGENSLGVADLSGNIWEWTTGCSVTARVDEAGNILERNRYCGVRIAEGRHRAVIIDFVRDAKRGGCAVGLPPDYLGFRLVRARPAMT